MGSSSRAPDPAPSPARAWEFHLFVSDRRAPHSARALANLRSILDRHLLAKYDLKVIDLAEEPDLAVREQLIVIPAVVRKHPAPPVRLAGDLSDEARIVEAFGLHARPGAGPSAEVAPDG